MSEPTEVMMSYDDRLRTVALFAEFESQSGVVFNQAEAGLILRYERPVRLTDEEAIALVGARYDELEVSPSDMEVIRQRAHRVKARENIGGDAGITSRPLAEIERYIPGITDRLLAEEGKIVFLGNGLSPAPLELLDMREDDPEVVIADCYDYELLLGDLQTVRQSLIAEDLPVAPLDHSFTGPCQTLVDALDSGRVQAVVHILGDGEPPAELCDAGLAVNTFGPPPATLAAQAACLKPGGELYTNYREIEEGPGISLSPIQSGQKLAAYVVTRLA